MKNIGAKMTRGVALDLDGHAVTEEEAARFLGFVDLIAYGEWSDMKSKAPEHRLRFILAEVCNLRRRLTIIESKLSNLDGRLIDAGTQGIG